MKRAILLRFTAILLLALGISSLFFYYFTGRDLLETNRASMLDTIRVVDYFLDYEGDLEKQLSRLHDAALDGNSRVTIIGTDGTVYADNEVGRIDGLENHMEREEVTEALSFGTGSCVRFSASLGESMLYVAAVSEKGDYIIRLSVPYAGMADYIWRIFPALLFGAAVAFGVSVMTAARFTDTIAAPLKEIAAKMERLKTCDFRADDADRPGPDRPDGGAGPDACTPSEAVCGRRTGRRTRFGADKGVPFASSARQSAQMEFKYEELNVIARTAAEMAEEIRKHVESLEREKRIRQEFFSNASHELKTPITSIRGYAELLDQGFVADDGVRKDFLARILKETQNMTNLIDDILLISRLEAKEAREELTDISLRPFLAQIEELMEPIAAEHQVRLHMECDPLRIEADVRQMRELVVNLVGNGIKYNHPGGNVWTDIRGNEGGISIRVQDDGCGIGPEDQERIFERFYRVDKGRSRKMGGTGLGLSIVKHIVKYYEGDISVQSAPGEGSVFLVILPFIRLS